MAIQAIIFVLGVWLFQQMSFIPSVFWLLAFIPLIFCAYRFVVIRRVAFHVLALALGFVWAGLFASWRLADVLPYEWESKEVELVGVVATLPQVIENGTRFNVNVERVLTPGAHVPEHIALAQYADGFSEIKKPTDLLAFHAGERWHLRVKLKRPHATMNPHGFDFEAWALERNIRAVGVVRKTSTNQRLSDFVWRPTYMIEAVRERVQSRISQLLKGRPYAGVLQALVMGDESEITQEDWQVFLRTGINHLMSISGLHITMLSGIAFAFVMALWRRSSKFTLKLPARKAAVVAGVLVALSYALVAGFSVPTQRTVYMLMVFAFALWSNKPVDIGKVLAYALFVVALLDPWAVLAPGFYLSFGAVAIIAYALGGRLGQSHWFTAAVRTQWVVTLGLVPLLLLMFQQISLISPVANALAIPIVSLLVVPLSLLGAILPIDGALLLAHWLMQALMLALKWMAALPLSTWQQQAPPVWTFLLAMFGLVWMLLPRGFPLRLLGVIFFLPLFLVMPKAPEEGAMLVTVLDVGQGLAVFVRTHQHTLLYDTGPQYTSLTDAGGRILVPYLRAEGVKRLNGLVVSHNDNDHSGGMRSVLSQVPVNWMASSLPQLPAELNNIKHLTCFAGQQWTWDGVRFEMLSPDLTSYPDKAIKDNNRSCVLKITSVSGSALLAGDIERPVEMRLAENAGSSLKADVLIVPHHGSRTSSSETWIEAVNPKTVIFTVGYRNRFGHPKPDIVARYLRRNIKTYRSDENGAVLFNFNAKSGWSEQAWRNTHRHYWHDK